MVSDSFLMAVVMIIGLCRFDIAQLRRAPQG
jgi:hypothetical protein